METLEEIIARWDSNEGKPYKGRLIDWETYGGDGIEPPTDMGCMCAQGQVLHLLGGWEPQRLRKSSQHAADCATAKLLGISVSHAILLRSVNDSLDGAPSIVLTQPEKILGERAQIILAFWRHLDRMTTADWDAVGLASINAYITPSWEFAISKLALAHRLDTLNANVLYTPAVIIDPAVYHIARLHNACLFTVVADASHKAGYEIAHAPSLGGNFFFLPLFGFADPEAVLSADQKETPR